MSEVVVRLDGVTNGQNINSIRFVGGGRRRCIADSMYGGPRHRRDIVGTDHKNNSLFLP